MNGIPDKTVYAPRISIITSVYKGAEHIEECIQSILGQSYPNIEYIIIDGGSTDGTVEVVERYRSRLHYFVSEKDNGIYHAWNKGLAQATGDWIAFVGADDRLWSTDVVANAVCDLEAALSENIRYVYGRINLLSSRGAIIDRWGMPWAEAKKDIFKHMTVTHCCAFHHRSLFDEYGKFDESFRIIGDYEFLLREFTHGGNAFFADRVFAGMKVGGISANLRMKLPLSKELIRAKTLNHIPPSLHDRLQVFKARLANLLIAVAGIKTLNKFSDLYRTIKKKPKIWSESD